MLAKQLGEFQFLLIDGWGAAAFVKEKVEDSTLLNELACFVHG